MATFILRRILQSIAVLAIVVLLTFCMIRFAPGSPFTIERAVAAETLEALEKAHGLHGSIWQQAGLYFINVAQGNLGVSLKNKNFTVNEIIAQTLPVSFLVGILAFGLAMSGGIFLGAIAAVYHQQWIDRIAMILALIGISAPVFILAPILILYFSIYLQWLPVAGWGTWEQLILPVICLAAPFTAAIARLVRSSFLEVLALDFVRTARAKGLPERRIIFGHVLKVAILPVVSYAGPLAAAILTGSVVVEKVFKIPGLGPYFVNSILNKDYFMVGGTVVVYSALLMFFNLVVDVLYQFLDRRVKLG